MLTAVSVVRSGQLRRATARPELDAQRGEAEARSRAAQSQRSRLQRE